MKRFEIAHPYVSVFGRSAASLQAIAEAGYDGAEIHLVNYPNWARVKKLAQDIKLAEQLGLTITIHQAWSLLDSPQHLFNWPLALAGYLPWDSGKLEEQIGEVLGKYPTVVYANMATNPAECRNKNLSLQTFSLTKNGKYVLPYDQFIDLVRKNNLRVVFDTQHVIEYDLGQRGVTNFGDQKETRWTLESTWDELYPWVNEIHLADCNQAGDTKGRNVPLGEGMIPLEYFGKLVSKGSEWSGRVVPEISPTIPQLFESHPQQVGRLVKVREHVERLFQI